MTRITYVGHATVQLEARGTRLLTDPVLRPRTVHLRRLAPSPAVAELREPDAVLISHAHFDHLDPPSLRLLGSPPVVAPRGCGRTLAKAGVREVTEIAPGESLRVGALGVTAFEMAHDGRRHPFSRARDTLAYVVEGPETVFFAGDTDVFDGMRHLTPELDVALLPIWGWGPRVGPGHMDPSRAAQAAALLEPTVAIPIHWGTLASPRVHWIDDPHGPALEFERQVGELGIPVEVRIVPPGGETTVGGPEPE